MPEPSDTRGEDDDPIRATVARLARPRPDGGYVIERAAILAAGSDSAAVEAWILAHAGHAEAVTATAADAGLHSRQLDAAPSAPRRFALPAGALGPVARTPSR